MERKVKRPPKVLKVYDSIPLSDAYMEVNPNFGKMEIKVRLIQYGEGNPMLDIRKHITGGVHVETGEPFTGYLKQGISLNAKQLGFLSDLISTIMVDLDPLVINARQLDLPLTQENKDVSQ